MATPSPPARADARSAHGSILAASPVLVTTEHYLDQDTWIGRARCRAGHILELPAGEFGRWCEVHASCEHPGGPEAGGRISVPAAALRNLVRVAVYVSIGRGGIGHQPDGANYPDSLARRALGALDDAGISVRDWASR